MEAHSYMRSSNFKILAAIVVLLIASRAHAQNSEPPPYLNPALPAEQRAADLTQFPETPTLSELSARLAREVRAGYTGQPSAKTPVFSRVKIGRGGGDRTALSRIRHFAMS